MSRVLIFGAGGFVGSYLCKEFLNNGYKVSGTDKGEGSALPSEVDFYKTDLMQADEVKKLIGQIQPDIIVNLAAISSVGASWNMPQTTIAINVIGALNIMEAARKSEQKPRILFVGSSEEYVISENPLDENTQLNANNPYGISKVTQEQLAKLYREQYGLKIYCVRPFNHTGIGQRDTFVLSVGASIVVSNKSCLPEIYKGVAHYIDPYNYNVDLDKLMDESVDNPKIILDEYTWERAAAQLLNVLYKEENR